MKARHRRFVVIFSALCALGLAVFFILRAFQENLVFFFTPSQVFAGVAPKKGLFRIGGLVEANSVSLKGKSVTFRVTDLASTVVVRYEGALPDLFREGRGVVAQGMLEQEGVFKASQVLAKHDEAYMPPEAAEALRKAGQPLGVPAMFMKK